MSFLTAAESLTARAVAQQLAALLPHVAAESGLDLLSPYFCDDAGDLPEIVNTEAAARIHAEMFGKFDGPPFYVHLIDALGLVSVTTFFPVVGQDGPWLVGDGIDLWSAPNEITARMVAAAIDAAGMDPYVECFLPSVPSSPVPSSPVPSSPVPPSPVPSSPVDSRLLATFRLPFVGGTVAIAHSRVKADPFKSEPFDCGFHGAVVAMAAGIIAGLSLCALAKTAQFNHCAQPSGDPARIAQCAKWLR